MGSAPTLVSVMIELNVGQPAGVTERVRVGIYSHIWC